MIDIGNYVMIFLGRKGHRPYRVGNIAFEIGKSKEVTSCSAKKENECQGMLRTINKILREVKGGEGSEKNPAVE